MRRRTSSTIPFGYDLDKDTNQLIPIEGQLEALEETKQFVTSKAFSLREGVEYLYFKTGRSLSHVGLGQIIKKNG